MSEKMEGGVPPQERKEGEGKPVTFHVAEHGLETSVDEVLSSEDFSGRDPQDFEPNRHWYVVTVANKGDKKRWIQLRNEWLGCAWTPNQSSEERSENADRMREIEKEMRDLENKARKED